MNKKIPRIFFKHNLDVYHKYYISNDMYHYCINVLRMKVHDIIEIFNNTNKIYYGSIIKIIDKKILIKILSKKNTSNPSKIYIHLIQAIQNYEIMKIILQKTTELGVNEITPIISKTSNITINSKKNINQKIQKWEKILIAACMQSGRNKIPKLNQVIDIKKYFQKFQKESNQIKIICNPKSQIKINNIPKIYKKIELLIGPKSGFTQEEIEIAKKNKFFNVSLGKHILKSETASIAAIAILQFQYNNL